MSNRPAPPSSTVPVDRAQLTTGARVIYDGGYAAGYLDGLAIQQRRGGYAAGRRDGWRERVDHEHRAWATMAAVIKAAGGPFALSHAELERRRAQVPPGYVPRPVPTFEECMSSWEADRAARGLAPLGDRQRAIATSATGYAIPDRHTPAWWSDSARPAAA